MVLSTCYDSELVRFEMPPQDNKVPIKVKPLVMERRVLEGTGVDFWNKPDVNKAEPTDLDDLRKHVGVDAVLRDYAQQLATGQK